MVTPRTPHTSPHNKPTLWEVTPEGIVVHYHRSQARIRYSPARFNFMLAGTQSGKTSLGPWWLLGEWRKRGDGDYLAVTSTYPLMKLKMLPEFLSVWRDLLDLGTWHKGDKVFETYDGKTRIIFGSARNSDSLESATAKGAWLDEVGQTSFRATSWEAILRRLSLHEGRVLGTTTVYNLGWLKQQVYDRWQAGDKDYNVVQFASIENPAFPPAEYERAKATMPDWRFDMFYRGLFSRPAGLIYDDFRAEYVEQGGHKVKPFDIPNHWPRYVGMDFGGVNQALVWLAQDPHSGTYYLYRESLVGGKTTAEHVAQARKDAGNENVVLWVGGAPSEGQSRRDWRQNGIHVARPPISDVESGIDRVVALIKTNTLLIFDTCTGMLDALGTYSRVLSDRYEPTEKIKNKSDYHLPDALRYVVCSLGLHTTVPREIRDDVAQMTTPSRWRGRR